MKNTFILWKNIIANPFEGYKGVNDSTKIFIPLLTIIVFYIIAVSLIIPIMISDEYGDAVVRVQINNMIEKGNEVSLEQQNAMAGNIKSPMFRNITVASAYAGGLTTIFLITLLISFILKMVVSAIKKDTVKFSLIFKIFLFASIVSMIQIFIKYGITLTGNWQRVLARVNDSAALQQALMSPISLAALFDRASVGDSLYSLIDTISDVFNWIYYIFLYAGLRVAVKLEKKPALIIIFVLAILTIFVGFVPTLFT